MNRRPQDLKDEIEALKRKIEQNRQAAADALQAADAALNSTVTETVRLIHPTLPPRQFVCTGFDHFSSTLTNTGGCVFTDPLSNRSLKT